jgi:type IV secretory pathway TraG/TraD family ATPase VirD4
MEAARASWCRDERTRSSVYTTAETVLAPFAARAEPAVPIRWFDPGDLLDGSHTVYLCAPAHDQRWLRGYFTALTKQVLSHAFARSTRSGQPLDPPLLVVLDEAAHIAPLAELDALAATCASHGVQLVTVWQDLAQLMTCHRSVSPYRRYEMAYKQSDTPPVLAPGCEELKCDVVGISKRQCRVVRRVHDATVGDAEFVQTDFPCL